MIQRIILLLLNGIGLGALPDEAAPGEKQANTLGHLLASSPDLVLPHLETLGLGHIASFPRLRRIDQPDACFGRMARRAPGTDAMTACWEIAGILHPEPLPSYRRGLPVAVWSLIERTVNGNVLRAKADALDEILVSDGPRAMREKAILAWGEAGGACHLAAHESIVPAKELFRLARAIRTSAGRALNLWRVGARPFAGSAGAWHWLDGWRDSCVTLPGKSLFEHLLGAEQLVTSFGKCGDFFNGTGFTRSIPVATTSGAWADLLKALSTTPRGLILASLFDDLVRVPRKQFGETMAEQLQGLDARLPDLQKHLKPGDLVCLTADQGRDLSGVGEETREYVPLLVFGPRLARGVNLGDRATYADLGQTIAEALGAARLSLGESFLQALRPG